MIAIIENNRICINSNFPLFPTSFKSMEKCWSHIGGFPLQLFKLEPFCRSGGATALHFIQTFPRLIFSAKNWTDVESRKKTAYSYKIRLRFLLESHIRRQNGLIRTERISIFNHVNVFPEESVVKYLCVGAKKWKEKRSSKKFNAGFNAMNKNVERKEHNADNGKHTPYARKHFRINGKYMLLWPWRAYKAERKHIDKGIVFCGTHFWLTMSSVFFVCVWRF